MRKGFAPLPRLCLRLSFLLSVETSVYQLFALRAAELRAPGVGVNAITNHFGVDHHTADEALRWFRSR